MDDNLGRPLTCAFAALAFAACAATPERPEPPSGAVDPGPAGLSTPGATAARADAPSLPRLPRLPGAAVAAAAPAAAGKMLMTREHCQALGRRFAEMAMGSESGPPHDEAEKVGRTFADGCARDMVGQQVEVAEYQCMLRAQAPEELLGCKR